MILCDASPLVSLISKSDQDHAVCVAAVQKLKPPLMSTWPCLTEAMHFLGRYGGWFAQKKLWDLVETGVLRIHELSDEDGDRMRVLMDQYQDTPMDLADASLVATAETLNCKAIFTLDSDFYVYRFRDAEAFDIVP